jgi:hypothetical protein
LVSTNALRCERKEIGGDLGKARKAVETAFANYADACIAAGVEADAYYGAAAGGDSRAAAAIFAAAALLPQLSTELSAGEAAVPWAQEVLRGPVATLNATLLLSARLRFYRSLLVSSKVPAVAGAIREALGAGFSVVVGLQTTGEAAAEAARARLAARRGAGGGATLTCMCVFRPLRGACAWSVRPGTCAWSVRARAWARHTHASPTRS